MSETTPVREAALAARANPRVFLIRHADADEGDRDPEHGRHLTELGKRQAEALARRTAGWHLDAIFSSDMHHSVETARALRVHHPHVPYTIDGVFREVSARAVVERLNAPDGELRARLDAVWQRILTLPHPVAAIVTHNGLIKYLIGRAIRHEAQLKPRFHSVHTGITGLEVRAGRRAHVQFFNDTRHLTPELVTDPKAWVEDAASGGHF